MPERESKTEKLVRELSGQLCNKKVAASAEEVQGLRCLVCGCVRWSVSKKSQCECGPVPEGVDPVVSPKTLTAVCGRCGLIFSFIER